MIELEKAFISFRISVSQWLPEDRFQGLLKIFDKYKGITDEITFFTSETHAPLPIKIIRERAELLAERMKKVRQRGYRTGINILATIGHHNENLVNSLSGDYTRMTDIDGNVCLGSFCPNDECMRSYIVELYEIVVSAGPDYIWIDDDVRLAGHLPVLYTCFCDNCLSIFEKEFKVKYTRESLKKAFNNSTVDNKLTVRTNWLKHNRNTISRLFELIEQTVHRFKPCLPIGFMTGDRFFEGYDFEKWAGILSGSGKANVMWRPGGGFYTDDRMSDLVGKSHDIGRQVSMLPESVFSIQSEVENFTYQRLKKSSHTTVLEAASHIAAGCTGTAFNVLSFYNEPLDEYEHLMSNLLAGRPFLDLMVEHLGRSKPTGIYTGWNKDISVAGNIDAGDWFSSDFWRMAGLHATEMFEIGLPAAYSLESANVTVLSGNSVMAMSKKEILKILSLGVYIDVQALDCLNKLGYSELTGFGIERVINEDCIEEFTVHILNGSFSGRKRDGRQSFWKCPADSLNPLTGKSQVLARMVDYAGNEIAPCCMGIFENRLNGRICVAGYYPWIFLQNLSKSSQIKSIMRWLSKDNLPAYISSFHKFNMWVRKLEKDNIAIAMINSSLDTSENVDFMLATKSKELYIYDMCCKETRLRFYGLDGPYKKFVLPSIGSWEMRFIITKKVVI